MCGMKKVLLVGQKYSIFDEPLRRTFQQLGWEIKFIDYLGTPFLMTNTWTQLVFNKLPTVIRNPLLAAEFRKIDKKLIETVDDFKPDLVFVSKGKNINLDMLDLIREKTVVVNWYPETMDHWKRISSIAPHYSHFFSFDPGVVSELQKLGCQNAHYLPFCADIEKDATYPVKNYKYNISFIGSYEPMRYQEREKILSQVKDLGLHIWGNKAWRNTSLREHYHSYATKEEMRQIHRDSKIVLGMHVFGIGGTGVNVRPFDVTGSGGFLLNHAERKDIFNLFEDGKEFISFGGTDDIREKVKYYLAHDEEREQIAKAGFEKTKKEHTYLDRIAEVLGVIGLND